MPEKFSLRFGDYIEGDSPDKFGLTPDAADCLYAVRLPLGKLGVDRRNLRVPGETIEP
jgi:hypothetical protein